MFELLVQADAKNGTRHSHAYYRAALELGFAVAAVDAHTSTTELTAIGDFQRLLLDSISSAGLPKPGEPEAERLAEAGGDGRLGSRDGEKGQRPTFLRRGPSRT